jgi:hypothetical protein
VDDAIELIDMLYSTATEYKVDITVSVDPNIWYDLSHYFGEEPQESRRYGGVPYFRHGPIRVEPGVGIKYYEQSPRRDWK